MITELEKEFFKVFGIKPKWKDKRVKNIKTYYSEEQAQYLRETTKNRNIQLCYPEITDRILLKLICKAYCLMFSIQGSSIEILKENILKEFIYWQKDVDKSEIQQLFKEAE